MHSYNQIDLVDFSSMPAGKGGTQYKYVVGILDVFSRFPVLRPLENKESKTVARELRLVYGILGYPKTVQSDQGKEFMGEVTKLLGKHHVEIRKSAPYHRQSQGKIERSNRTWKSKLRVDLRTHSQKVSWADKLQDYQDLYNSGVHRSLRKHCPFEVFYGRKPSEPSISSSDTRDSDSMLDQSNDDLQGVNVHEYSTCPPNTSSGSNRSSSNSSSWSQHFLHVDSIRKESVMASDKAAASSKLYHSQTNAPSQYQEGDDVVVRLRGPDKKRSRTYRVDKYLRYTKRDSDISFNIVR